MADRVSLLLFDETPRGPSLLFVQDAASGRWRLPGGSVEPRRQRVSALRWYVRRELSADLRTLEPVALVQLGAAPSGPLRVHLFRGRLRSARIRPGPGIRRVGWLTRQDVLAAPADVGPQAITHLLPALDGVW